MSIRKKTLNFLSTAFLVFSLLVAVGLFTTDAFTPQNVKAEANTQDDLEICSNTLPPKYCGGTPANCYCEVVITPEAQ